MCAQGAGGGVQGSGSVRSPSLWVNSVPAAEVLYEGNNLEGLVRVPSSCCFLGRFFHRPQAWSGLVNKDAPSPHSPPHPSPLLLSPIPHPPLATPPALPLPSTMPDAEWQRGTWREQEDCYCVLNSPPSPGVPSFTPNNALMRYVNILCNTDVIQYSVLKQEPTNVAQTYWHLWLHLYILMCEWKTFFFCKRSL